MSIPRPVHISTCCFLARLAAIIVLIAICAASISVPAKADQSSAEPQARIIVTGIGRVDTAPDFADVGCGVTTRAKTARDATDANSKAMNAVQAALRDAGVAPKDIQTEHFSLRPDYAPAQPNTEPKLIGFSVQNRLKVTIRQIDKVGDILDRLIAAGATDVGSVGFEYADPSKLVDRAREAAIADARRQAELYARAAGVNLGNIIFISDEPNARTLFSPQAAMRTAATAVPISIGQDALTAQVTVGFDFAR